MRTRVLSLFCVCLITFIALPLQDAPGPLETLRMELSIAASIDKAVPGAKADVRSLGSLPLIIRGRILTEGSLIYSADESARVAFETSVRDEYFDFLPVYRAYQEESLARMRKGFTLRSSGSD